MLMKMISEGMPSTVTCYKEFYLRKETAFLSTNIELGVELGQVCLGGALEVTFRGLT